MPARGVGGVEGEGGANFAELGGTKLVGGIGGAKGEEGKGGG